MSDFKRLNLRYLDGPSLDVPYPAVIAEIASPFDAMLSPNSLQRFFVDPLSPEFERRVRCPNGEISYVRLAALIADALQDTSGLSQFSAEVKQRQNGFAHVVLSCFDPRVSALALQAGLEIAQAVFQQASAGKPDATSIKDLLQKADKLIRLYQPDFIACALVRVARSRGIPVYPVSPGSRIWLFGQGSAGQQFFEAATQNDSLTGAVLTRNKVLSNQLVTSLGLPGVRHRVAHDMLTARQHARELGFPVVVKPLDLAKGQGVTTDIRTEHELEHAVSNALAVSAKGALVEKYVPGDDHRLTVVGGEFTWAVRRSPPRIVGDGLRTIAELVEAENLSRNGVDIAAGFTSRLTVDSEMKSLLARQGYAPGDKPANGVIIQLRRIANTATGGTITDCSADIHPENRALAETIARGFRMDTVGIDFITTDISRSWRELECAVIEVNATPGISSDTRAEAILRDKFPNGGNGRIPSVILIDGQPALLDRVAKALKVSNRRVGKVNGAATELDEIARSQPGATLPERIRALLLDSGCDAIAIDATVADIERHGFPLDRCDLVVIAATAPVSEPLRRLCEHCSAAVVDTVTEQNIDEKALTVLKTLIGDGPDAAGRQ